MDRAPGDARHPPVHTVAREGLETLECRAMRKGPLSTRLLCAAASVIVLGGIAPPVHAEPAGGARAWMSENRVRILLRVNARGRKRSGSPARVVIDFQEALGAQGVTGKFDEATVAVLPVSAAGESAAAPSPREKGGSGSGPVPHRIDPLFGSTKATLHFVVPDDASSDFAVYFDTVESGRGDPLGFHGLVGDGDLFREERGRREIAASHFDQFVDFDGDGDLDLFQGGVEPYVRSFENTGGNRLVKRGRLASNGELFALPSSRSHRSWVTVAFFDIDLDGDQDFFPSFNDGPDSGQIVFYRNATGPGDQLAFDRVGPLKTVSGAMLAGGVQAGGWFPSITFVRNWEGRGDGFVDALVGSNNRCWLHRGLGADADGVPRFADAVAVQAGGEDINLVNPRFECADVDGDGDLDLFAGTQPGPVLFFRNEGERSRPRLASGLPVAFNGKYLIGDAHSGVKVSDFDGDGLPDLAAGRFWERADLSQIDPPREFGGFWRNVGTRVSPRFEPSRTGGPYTEELQVCDAIRQNCVRAVDWDEDGRLDLLAGDTDGSVWLFANKPGRRFPLFSPGRRLLAAGWPLSVAGTGGHARLDVCDWNGDGRRDLFVADGSGTVTLFPGKGSSGGSKDAAVDLALDAGRKLEAGGKPIQVGSRSSALACDWDLDGRTDLVLADDRGYYFLKNEGSGAEPALAAPRPILFGKKPVSYVRPNLGSFVDWDGDGKRDLIGCHFENSIRFYRNVGSGAPGTEPEFADPEGITILAASSPQMISGADVVDWNGDGDLDILTGQGHGGSGLRFFERDWIEDELQSTHPIVAVHAVERKPDTRVAAEATGPDLLSIVRRYADTMIERGRDTHGPEKSGLFLSALDRTTLAPLLVRPAAPAGIRRGDRPGRAWSAMNGANPHLDQNLLRVLFTLGEITGDARYARAADEEMSWFLVHAMSPATSLLAWGEHLSWDVMLDEPISGGDEMMHEFARPWVLWDRCFALAPEASRKFAVGLWEHQIADHKTGGFDRHAPYFEHGPVDGKDFARHAGFYIGTWCHAWKHTADDTFLRAIESLLARFERKRIQKDGSMAATIGPLDCETAAAMVPEPLQSRLRAFAAREDDLILPDLRKQVEARGKPGPRAPEPAAPPMWSTGYSASTLASSAMFCLARHAQTGNPAYRDVLVAIADAYLGSRPGEDLDVWPMSYAHAISAQVAAHRFTSRPVYLEQALLFARTAAGLFWQDNPLPRASKMTGHYETITGADSLALALLEVHAAAHGLTAAIPLNTIDR